MLEVLFGSVCRAKLLEWLYTHPSEWFYVRQLGKILALDSTNVARELGRLHNLGIVSLRTSGNQKHFSANPESPVFEDLKNLVVRLGLPKGVFLDALGPLIDDIDLAFIYGSFASGRFEPSSDIDLLLVGDMGLEELSPLLAEAEEYLGRQVNPSILKPREFAGKLKKRGFLWRVARGDKVFIVGDEHELERLAGQPLD
ncbi:ArsR family transcriptional regulator [Candidatus Fermentibacteria bacterium]|nr:ArsR family transcriptional regulator [Candidatus Fermentibacteria bacterium]